MALMAQARAEMNQIRRDVFDGVGAAASSASAQLNTAMSASSAVKFQRMCERKEATAASAAVERRTSPRVAGSKPQYNESALSALPGGGDSSEGWRLTRRRVAAEQDNSDDDGSDTRRRSRKSAAVGAQFGGVSCEWHRHPFCELPRHRFLSLFYGPTIDRRSLGSAGSFDGDINTKPRPPAHLINIERVALGRCSRGRFDMCTLPFQVLRQMLVNEVLHWRRRRRRAQRNARSFCRWRGLAMSSLHRHLQLFWLWQAHDAVHRQSVHRQHERGGEKDGKQDRERDPC